MNFFKALLGAVGDAGTSYIDKDGSGSGLNKFTNNAMATFVDAMEIVMPIVFSVVLAMGVFFSLKLGINYAKQETTEKREEAKKRLVGAIVGFGIGILAAVVCWILFTGDIAKTLFNLTE